MEERTCVGGSGEMRENVLLVELIIPSRVRLRNHREGCVRPKACFHLLRTPRLIAALLHDPLKLCFLLDRAMLRRPVQVFGEDRWHGSTLSIV